VDVTDAVFVTVFVAGMDVFVGERVAVVSVAVKLGVGVMDAVLVAVDTAVTLLVIVTTIGVLVTLVDGTRVTSIERLLAVSIACAVSTTIVGI